MNLLCILLEHTGGLEMRSISLERWVSDPQNNSSSGACLCFDFLNNTGGLEGWSGFLEIWISGTPKLNTSSAFPRRLVLRSFLVHRSFSEGGSGGGSAAKAAPVFILKNQVLASSGASGSKMKIKSLSIPLKSLDFSKINKSLNAIMQCSSPGCR